MRIAFDHQAFTMQRFGGVSRYFVKLAEGLVDLGQEVGIFAGVYQNYYLKSSSSLQISGIGVDGYIKKTGTPINYFNHFLTQYQLKSFSPELIHETFYAFARTSEVRAKRVITVHDMIHELFPESFKKNDPLSKYKRNACERADHIICVSEHTKRDLIHYFGISEKKISVTHLAVNPQDSSSIITSPQVEKPYILYVGARSGYKNFELLVKAFGETPSLNKDFQLVAFGGEPFTKEEKAFIGKFSLTTKDVKHISGSDELLMSLYTHAEVFVYPSMYEGFGLPPLEAMNRECPVISSNRSSIPEVVGDAAIFFDPSDSGQISEAIQRVVFSPEIRQDLIHKGKKRLSHFSWEKTARQTLDIYQRLV